MTDKHNLDLDAVREQLVSAAICGTSCHAEAVSALLGAMGQILTLRFPPEMAAAMIIGSVQDALTLIQPVGRA